MTAENTPLDPYKSPVYAGSGVRGSRVRSARFAMYGAYFCVAMFAVCAYVMMRLIGDHFFGLVKSNETASFYASAAGGMCHIAIFVGVACSVYSLYFGNLKIRLACVIPAVILSRFFIQIAGSLVTKMLGWL